MTERANMARRNESFSAVLDDGDVEISVGTFETEDEAREFGLSVETRHLKYVRVQQRMNVHGLRDHIRALAAAGITLADTDRYRKGVVTRWHPHQNWGLIVDTVGRQWFVHKEQTSGQCVLDVDTEVSFSGNANPAPGERWPQTFSVNTVEPAAQESVPEPEREPEPPSEPVPEPEAAMERAVVALREIADLFEAMVEGKFDELLRSSSVGTPRATAIQELTPPHVIDRILATRPKPTPPSTKDRT